MDIVVVANLINLIGVLSLLASHTLISLASPKKGFVLSFLGGLLVSTGSYLLGSIPIVILNLLWMLISIYGFLHFEKKANQSKKYIDSIFFGVFLILSAFVLFFFMESRDINLLAYYTTFIYVTSYFLFASGFIRKESYLLYCIIGFFLVIPHLADKMQYAIFLNEGYGFIVSFLGLYKSYRIRKSENKSLA